jgi:pSer/pThr/pTyr-binding forkhead associated (FHA) protein
MIVCSRCGKDNQDHYKFCLGCGADLAPPKHGDVGMMKTMMADQGGRPSGAAFAPAGMPSPAAAPLGPPPGVPGFSAAHAVPVATARRCPSCGLDVPPGFRFCGSCGFRIEEAAQPAPTPAPQRALMVEQPRPSLLTLIRPDGTEGGTHELRRGENLIGRNYGTIFENDGYLSPRHAEINIAGAGAVVKDLSSLNGVFVKITQEEELVPGQIFRIGQELLRFDLLNPPEPAADGTEIMGSPNPGYWGRLSVIIGKGVDGAAYPLLGETVTFGRERGEINFPEDGYVSGLHARMSVRDGRVYLSDLGSSNGTFMKVSGERHIGNDSFVLLGQQLFRLNLA